MCVMEPIRTCLRSEENYYYQRQTLNTVYLFIMALNCYARVRILVVFFFLVFVLTFLKSDLETIPNIINLSF